MKLDLKKILPSGFKQYNTKSHEKGGQKINKKGKPTKGGDTEIELKESAYTYKNLDTKTYVFSDKLNTSPMLKSIISKYSKKKMNKVDMDEPTLNAMEQDIKSVEHLNEGLKATIGQTLQKRYGGSTKEMADGGALDPLPSSNPITSNTRFEWDGSQHSRSDMGGHALTSRDWNPEPLEGVARVEGEQTSNKLQGFDASKALRTAGLIGGAVDLFRPTEKESAIHTDYGEAQNQMNQLDSSLDQSRQDAIAASNLGTNLNRNSSGSFNQFRSREIANIGALQDSLGNIAQSEQQLANNINLQRARFESGKAQDFSNENKRIIDNNQRNSAAADAHKRGILGDIVHEADRLSTIAGNKQFAEATNQEIITTLSTAYENFDIDDEFVQGVRDLASGKITKEEFTKIKESKSPIKYTE